MEGVERGSEASGRTSRRSCGLRPPTYGPLSIALGSTLSAAMLSRRTKDNICLSLQSV